MTEDEKKEKRPLAIGGTDIAAIVGCDPDRSAFDVYASKVLGHEIPDNELMEWGREHELSILRVYERRTGNPIVCQGDKRLVHPERPWQVGKPDALMLRENGGVEAKNHGQYVRAQFGEPGTDQVPERHLVQCTWYMSLTVRELWDLAAHFGGNSLLVFRILHSADLEDFLLNKADAFMRNHLLAGIPPPLDHGEASREYLKHTFPQNRLQIRGATQEEETDVRRLFDLGRLSDSIEKDEEGLKNRIKNVIGDHDGVQGAGFRVLWKNSKDSEIIDTEKLKSELGEEFLARFKKPRAGGRRFTVHYDEEVFKR